MGKDERLSGTGKKEEQVTFAGVAYSVSPNKGIPPFYRIPSQESLTFKFVHYYMPYLAISPSYERRACCIGSATVQKHKQEEEGVKSSKGRRHSLFLVLCQLSHDRLDTLVVGILRC